MRKTTAVRTKPHKWAKCIRICPETGQLTEGEVVVTLPVIGERLDAVRGDLLDLIQAKPNGYYDRRLCAGHGLGHQTDPFRQEILLEIWHSQWKIHQDGGLSPRWTTI